MDEVDWVDEVDRSIAGLTRGLVFLNNKRNTKDSGKGAHEHFRAL